MKGFPLNEIPPSCYFTQTVYLDNDFVVASPETPLTPELIKALANWGFNEVYSSGEPRKTYHPKDASINDDNIIYDKSAVTDLDKIQAAERFYTSLIRHVETIYAQALVKNELNYQSVAENMKNICDYTKGNHRYLMRVQRSIDIVGDEDYLISHTVNSTIIAIIIGLYLKLPSHRLIELGIAALLHEIGMMKLPSQSYMSNSSLNEQEKKLILTHPVLAYNILKASGFPLTITLAVLEHHERENGNGYPQQLTGDKISLYAKIIAVACSYEAIQSKRPHKEEKNGYTGMVELLKNEGKQYNDTVIRALVYSLSIYPIGLYVLLSSGNKGQVIDINPENPRFPVVQIFGELLPDGKNKTAQTSAGNLYIIRPLTPGEIGGKPPEPAGSAEDAGTDKLSDGTSAADGEV